MGLLKKAATYTIVDVSGQIPPLKEIKLAIENTPVVDIEGSSKGEAFGFCHISDVYEKGVIQGETVLGFGVRHDKKSTSKELLKKKYKEAIKKARAEFRGSKKKMTKDDRRLIKENIQGELNAGATPIQKLIEVLWDTEGKRLYIGSGSKGAVDACTNLLINTFKDATFMPWNPLSPDTEHSGDAKGTKDNFQNAFFTWIFYKTKVKKDEFWLPVNIKFLQNDTTVSVRGDTAISLETYLAVYNGRMVDALDLGCSVGSGDARKEYQVSLSRGSWAFKKLSVKPNIEHENIDSAVFERAAAFREFTECYLKQVREFEEIRNDEKEDGAFWNGLLNLASKQVKEGLENLGVQT